ncbi:iron-sulfur cluster assembly protein [Ammoniphilus sp. 3BR4]|uniref:iron-sulfur cluster assembly protein n=1 Tax=Ammoniphilus sp. 3BR4 TaxID=3158265 RepID=UPI003466C3A1
MGKKNEVMEKLAIVYDPELDQSVTEMGFIEEVNIENETVTIYFRLPTYWCSPNFAYIMAEDMRDRVQELPWVSEVVITLKDHCAADEVNTGVTKGKSFSEVFSHLAGGDLEQLREKFRIKTFMSRQERLLRNLLDAGMDSASIVALTIRQLQVLAMKGNDDIALVDRYLASRTPLGFDNAPDQLAFIQSTGENIDPNQFSAYLLDARRTRMSMEFNAHYCRGLLETRYALEKTTELEVS